MSSVETPVTCEFQDEYVLKVINEAFNDPAANKVTAIVMHTTIELRNDLVTVSRPFVVLSILR